MKNIICLILIFYGINLSAQCITFTYDAAGDRVARNICPQELQVPQGTVLAQPTELSKQITKQEPEILIFPNPTEGIIEIRSDYFSAESKILVTDVLGRVFYSGSLSDRRIDLSGYQAGRYYVRIVQGDRVSVVSVIRE